MNKIKILHIIETLGRGGAERRLVNDLKCMNKDLFENTVCTVTQAYNSELVSEIEALGIKVTSLDVGLNYRVRLRKLLFLSHMIRNHSIDIIHSQLFFSDLYACMLSFFFRKKIFIRTIQSTPYLRKNAPLYSRTRFLLERFIFSRRFHKCIAVSDMAMNMAVKHLHCDPTKVIVIPNSVDSKYLKEGDSRQSDILRQELGIDRQAIVLLTIGRFVREKGHHILLKALNVVSQTHKNLKLVMVGIGPLQEELKKMVSELGLDSTVLMVGVHRDIAKFLNMSDFFIFPSLEGEGLPVSLLEALALGKTCLVADTGPIRDVIKDNITGYLYAPEDYNQLSQILLRVLAQGHKNTHLGYHAREVIKNYFSDYKCAKSLEGVYGSLK